MRALLLILGLTIAVAGCEAPPEASSDPFSVAPMDFSMDVTVLTGAGVRDRPEAHLRQSRYVLQADGSLLYGADNTRGSDSFPALARRLNRRQVAEIWSLAHRIGFADADQGLGPSNFDLIEPQPEEIVYLVMLTGSKRRWGFIRHSADIEHPDPASVELVRTLAQLAWATDIPGSRAVMMPYRYDFGPDPYARYREP